MKSLPSLTKEKSLQVLVKDLDDVFSIFIRARDLPGGVGRCFVCGNRLYKSQAQNGHYVDRDQMPTRYDEMNCHAVCQECNCFDNNHKLRYHTMLTLLYGFGAPESLEAKSKSLQKYMRFEIISMTEEYKAKIKKLK